MEAYVKHPEFFAYERGELNDVEFRSMLRRIFSLQATDIQIDEAWNAMLLGVPAKKLELVKKLKNRFSVYVLSNTNNIHIQYVNEKLLNGQSLDAHFYKCYYSHAVGLRKPEPEIYRHVLEDAGLNAATTIFLDDNIENIQAAHALGIQTIHITHPDQVYDLVE
jgi:putative hydrolase of the HAD superfamily